MEAIVSSEKCQLALQKYGYFYFRIDTRGLFSEENKDFFQDDLNYDLNIETIKDNLSLLWENGLIKLYICEIKTNKHINECFDDFNTKQLINEIINSIHFMKIIRKYKICFISTMNDHYIYMSKLQYLYESKFGGVVENKNVKFACNESFINEYLKGHFEYECNLIGDNRYMLKFTLIE
jgi:hypothetical protein